MRIRERKHRITIPAGVLFAAITGFLGGLLLAPYTGKRSRSLLRDKLTKYSRHLMHAVQGRSKDVSNRMRGRIHEIRDLRGMTMEPPPEDRQIVQRVRADLGHDPNVPLGQLNIEAAEGVVHLRGEVDSRETAEYVASRVAGVEGVRGVVNELHPVVQ